MGRRITMSFVLLVALGGVACDPTTIPEFIPDAEIDAEIDMEVDMGPTACERACAAIADCSAGEDHCIGIGSGERQSVVDLCAPVCESASALASVINGTDVCREQVAFFEGASAEFQRLCNTPPQQADMGEAMPEDMGVAEMDMASEEPADMGAE